MSNTSRTKSKERLDILMLEKGLAPTRTKAQALIMSGRVLVQGQVQIKPAATVSFESRIELSPGPRYVSRGGEKLEGALQDLKISPQDRVCLDVGASTGGFTDCLLQHGAKKVYAVDVGRSQLDVSLKSDPRVVSQEEMHILKFGREQFSEIPDLVVVDVSFISLTKVLPHLKKLLHPGATVLPMVKPQFEVGPKFLKKGVVRDEAIQKKAVEDIIAFAKQEGFLYLDQAPSRLKGPKGNQEYFLYLKLS